MFNLSQRFCEYRRVGVYEVSNHLVLEVPSPRHSRRFGDDCCRFTQSFGQPLGDDCTRQVGDAHNRENVGEMLFVLFVQRVLDLVGGECKGVSGTKAN